jgi:hypothetical protein
VPSKTLSGREVKRRVLAALREPDWEERLQSLGLADQTLVAPLFTSLYSKDRTIRWHGVSAFGSVVPAIAEQAMERARVIMRRFIWNLNDESGGIGWGSPEAMGEIMARHSRLAGEYHRILLTYIVHKEGPDNFLEHLPLREGAYWGAARLTQARPGLVRPFLAYLVHGLRTEQSAYCLAHLCLCLQSLGPDPRQGLERLDALRGDRRHLSVYWNREFMRTSVGELAARAAASLRAGH